LAGIAGNGNGFGVYPIGIRRKRFYLRKKTGLYYLAAEISSRVVRGGLATSLKDRLAGYRLRTKRVSILYLVGLMETWESFRKFFESGSQEVNRPRR
jgi:hypothetical protein